MTTSGLQCARKTLRHAAPSLVEGTLIPLVVFTSVVHSLGVTPALWASLLWSGCALGRRIICGRRLTGVLVLGAVGTCFRLATVLWTASPFIFFLQPVLATMATSVAFAVSVLLRRPLAAKLGADLVPLGEEHWADPGVRQACSQLSLVWSAALFANAALTLWMLSNLDVATFVLLRPLVGVVTTLPAIVTSFVVGAAVVRHSDGRVWLSGAPVAPAPLVPATLIPATLISA